MIIAVCKEVRTANGFSHTSFKLFFTGAAALTVRTSPAAMA